MHPQSRYCADCVWTQDARPRLRSGLVPRSRFLTADPADSGAATGGTGVTQTTRMCQDWTVQGAVWSCDVTQADPTDPAPGAQRHS